MSSFDMPSKGKWEVRAGWVVRHLMEDLKLEVHQAAGLVGNQGHETSGYTRLQEAKPTVPGSKGGYGWSQWTGQRRKNFEDWCRQRSLAMSSDEANYGYTVAELKRTVWRGFLKKLREAPTLEEACFLVHAEYERSADAQDGTFKSYPSRMTWAQRALAGATQPAPEPPAPEPPAPEPPAPEPEPQPEPPEPTPEPEPPEPEPEPEPPADEVPAIDVDLLADLVRATQRYVGVEPDGIMGPITFAAVKAAQRQGVKPWASDGSRARHARARDSSRVSGEN